MTKKADAVKQPARKTIGMHVERAGGGECGGTKFEQGGGRGSFINGKFVPEAGMFRCLKCGDVATEKDLKLQHNPVAVPDGNL